MTGSLDDAARSAGTPRTRALTENHPVRAAHAIGLICQFIDAFRHRFGVVPICRAGPVRAGPGDRPENVLGQEKAAAVTAGAARRGDHQDAGRDLRTRPERAAGTGVALRGGEGVGVAAPPGCHGGQEHGGADHAGQRVARQHPPGAEGPHHGSRSGGGFSSRLCAVRQGDRACCAVLAGFDVGWSWLSLHITATLLVSDRIGRQGAADNAEVGKIILPKDDWLRTRTRGERPAELVRPVENPVPPRPAAPPASPSEPQYSY